MQPDASAFCGFPLAQIAGGDYNFGQMKTPPDQDGGATRRVLTGFAIGLFLAVFLNLAPYWLFASPSAEDAARTGIPVVRKLGLPRTFWTSDSITSDTRLSLASARKQPPKPEFYWGGFLLDSAFALAAAGLVAQCWDRLRAPAKSAEPAPPAG